MDTIPEIRMNFKSRIKLNFDGGNLTSDSGMLLYKNFDEKIGFSKEIRNSLNIKDDIDHRKHENEDVIIQRIYQNAAGYHADDDADDLRFDSVFQEIMEKEDLASQPTISRVNNKVNKNTMKQLQTTNLNLVDKVHTIASPKKLIFDLDSTNSKTYGNQYGAAYNPHYGAEGYHPLLLFDGNTGDLLKAELRSGNVYTSRQSVRFVGPVFKKYNKKFNNILLYLRADSGFAMPGLYNISEEHDILYTIRLKANSKLYDLAQPFTEKLDQKFKGNLYKKHEIYGEFEYQAQSWDKKRKVIVKIKKPKGKLTYEYTFIVTNIKNWSPKKIVKFYCQRATMENFIKEGKNGFALGKMNSTEYWANANKLQQMGLAYNLNNWLRRLCFPGKAKSYRIATIRNRIIKIAARIVNRSKYVFYKLASSCPYKKLFYTIFENIKKLEFA